MTVLWRQAEIDGGWDQPANGKHIMILVGKYEPTIRALRLLEGIKGSYVQVT